MSVPNESGGMRGPHQRGRVASLWRQTPRVTVFGTVLAGVALACAQCAMALDPALDVSQYAHTAWRVRDGFTQGTINSIAQTADGYLWLGTEFGLYRFDGVRAVPWQPLAGEQLPSNYIRSLLASRDGTLWIGTFKGLASWKDGKLIQYSTPADQSIDTLVEDDEGTIWVGTLGIPTGRLCTIRGGGIHCYGEDGSLGRWVHFLFEDRQRNVWAASETGLWRWKPGPRKRYSMPSASLSGHQGVIEEGRGALLVITSAGIRRFVNEKTESYLLPGGGRKLKASSFFLDHNGGLWVAVGFVGGLAHVHDGKTDFFSLADGLSGDHIGFFFEDREGNIWIATNGGLDRFREYAVPTFSLKQGLSDAGPWSVLASRDGSVWLGTAKGLDRWSDGRISTYDKHDGKLNGLAPHCLLQDRRGQIWASTTAGFGHLENTRFIPVSSIPDGVVRAIAEDTGGNLWIANQNAGLIRLRDGHVVQQIPWTQLGHQDFATALGADPSHGGLWVGFYNGGVIYFGGGRVGAAYTGANGLGEGLVGRFRFDSDGTVWAATQGGLSRLKNGRVATLSTKNGLPCDAVNTVIRDNEQSFWLYTACGMVRITRPEVDAWSNAVDKQQDTKLTIQFMVFDTSDGVRSESVGWGFSPKVTRSSDGRLWFATPDGLSVVDPKHLPFNKLLPPVRIEQITADRKNYDPVSYGNGRVPLPAGTRDLEIDYTALSLAMPEKVHFRYKLEGRDRDWQDAGNRRQAFYSDLPPRGYRFRVAACNNSGVWNEEGAVLDFAIAPAYYQTNWFRAACVAAVLALLWGIYRIRVGVLEQRQQLLEQNQRLLQHHQNEITALNDQLMKAQEEERSRIAGELHDGVLQQITSLTLLLGALKRQVLSEAEAKTKIADLQKKLMQVGTDIRQLSHELHPPVLQEAGLPAALSDYCEEFSKARGIPVSCEADASVRELSPGAALCIYRIAQEALGNVAKHSNAKKVQVRLTRADGSVCLCVSDDGVGFASNQPAESGGLGLINMRERVRQLHGALEFESEPGLGTTVRAEVPFRPAS